jgi:peptidyl-prolyl cis-trans isomerase A (cyclophilin A)
MNRRFAIIVLPLMLALTAATAPKSVPKRVLPPAPLPDVVRVALVTEAGTIEIDLDHKHAPLTVENFVHYVDTRRLDGTAFYRVMRLKWGEQPNGLIQGGLSGDPQKVFKPVAHEPTSTTGILHTPGAISMARWAPGTAMADFSILLSAMPGLDADPASSDPDRQAGFAAFGHVSSGMDVVRKIYDAPLSLTKGQGVMKGQMLDPTVRILTVRRVTIPAPAPVLAPVPAPAPVAEPTPATP